MGFASCLCWQLGCAAAVVSDPEALLTQAQALATTDHPRFLQQLAQLNQDASRLTAGQRWRLRYLNAWEARYEGDYAKSESTLREIIQQSNEPLLADRASALLLGQLGHTRHYVEAFELANRVAARLPHVTDAKVRSVLLLNLAQTLGYAGKTDVAVHYARMAMAAAPAGDRVCYAANFVVEALYDGHRLKLDSPELQQAIAACSAAHVRLYETSLQLTQADLYIHDKRPREALALLDRIEPDLRANGYAQAMLSARVNRARALAALGDDQGARKAALAVAGEKANGTDTWLKDAYEVLYRVEEKQGHAAAALDYYEKYAALDKAYLDDVNARAMAYETVQQHVLAQKLDTERLAQQNATLRVRQALAAKTAEANRLYIILLLAALAFGALVMFRLKRSQLRFRQLSRMDGLTAVLNRQSFMQDAEGVLRGLQRESGAACMVYMDLDHFKRINDTHGHAVGDAVLRQVVATCRQHLRAVDLFGRLGGEEFGLLLVDCAREQALLIANRIRRAVEATATAHAQVTVTATVSLGLAFGDTSGWDMAALCRDADAALYQAKREGRNRVVGASAGGGADGGMVASNSHST